MANEMLKGIKVVELGTHVAVPYCARELADMGAEVIKVEPPKGESYRARMSMLFQLPYKEDPTVFIPYNVNKRSLVLNLKTEEGHDAMLKLLETADVFLTNTREVALERLGLSFESLQKKYPSLIIANVNGFGTKGKDKDRTGYDATSFWSPAGMIQEWGYKEDTYAFKPFYGFGDAVAASQLTTGVVTALFNRTRTGKGDVIRVSLLGTGLWQNVCGLLRYQVGHQFPKPFNQPIVPLDNFYRTKDGKWFLSSEERWDLRCKYYFEMFGTPELMDDPNWNSMLAYVNPKTIAEKVEYFREHIGALTSEEIQKGLEGSGAIFEFLYETDDVLKNQQAWDNEMFRNVTTKSGKELTITNIPITFASQGFTDQFECAPNLGEHSVEILKELGYTDEAIHAMIEKGAVVAE